jgi:hypothetical protein
MEWQNIVQEHCHIRIVQTEKIFSRRNQVFSVIGIHNKDQAVHYAVKLCTQSEAAQEAAILRSLKKGGIKVPALVWNNTHILVMEYIEGILLSDLLAKEEPSSLHWVTKLADWFFSLHSLRRKGDKVISMPDLNPRNFIFKGPDFYGLDFEQLLVNPPERDLGGIAAFIINSDPMFVTWKYQAIKQLVNYYGEKTQIDKTALYHYFLREMKEAAARRKGQRDILLKKVQEYESQGMVSVELLFGE